jgi:ATP-binding cassette subfamily F protein 3
LLRGICDRLLLVEHGRVREFDGDLDDYACHLVAAPAAARQPPAATDRREQRRQQAEARNRRSPLRQRLRAVEERLQVATVRRTALEKQLGDSEFYARATAAEQSAAAREAATLRSEIDQLETEWLEISEQLAE